RKFPAGIGLSPATLVPLATWVWVGISVMLSVWPCSPPLSPMVCPLPICMGVRPCRSGRAKLTRPSPPYVVPSRENSAWVWLIGSSCPSHKAHPLGGNPNDMILISDRNGSAIPSPSFSGVLRGRAARRAGEPAAAAAGRGDPARGAVAGVVALDEGDDGVGVL